MVSFIWPGGMKVANWLNLKQGGYLGLYRWISSSIPGEERGKRIRIERNLRKTPWLPAREAEVKVEGGHEPRRVGGPLVPGET
jgi:hypothetical protein